VSVVAPAPAAPRRERKSKAKPQDRSKRVREATVARRRHRSPVAPGVAWVLLLATLFGGIVALNVGALRNSIDASRLDAQGVAVRTQNADLTARVASLSGYGRISKVAGDLGMVQAKPSRKDFITLKPAGKGHRDANARGPRTQARKGQGAAPTR
jgi:cell division protein FtsL